MGDVYDRMGRLMQEFIGDGTLAMGIPQVSAPADIEETDDDYIVEIDVPGGKRDDINLELRDSQLVVSGEIKERQRQGVLRRKSRLVGEFEHVIALPGEVDAERVEANFLNGVLTVRLGKATASRPRRIEIKSP
jgi:HSP20 family protein